MAGTRMRIAQRGETAWVAECIPGSTTSPPTALPTPVSWLRPFAEEVIDGLLEPWGKVRRLGQVALLQSILHPFLHRGRGSPGCLPPLGLDYFQILPALVIIEEVPSRHEGTELGGRGHSWGKQCR